MESLKEQQLKLEGHKVQLLLTSDIELDLQDVKMCVGDALRKQFGPSSVYVPKFVRFSKKYNNFVCSIQVTCPQRTFESGGVRLTRSANPEPK